MPKEYSHEKHCGAKSKNSGLPCTLPKGFGTDHLGTGRCKYHGGASTGAKTKEGKAKVGKNTQTHGLFAKVLKGEVLEHYNEAQLFTNEESLQSSFWMLQAKIMHALSGEIRFKSEFAVVAQTLDVLVEKGKISDETALEVKLRLGNVTNENIARVTATTATLINAMKTANTEGDLQRQNTILKQFLMDVLKKSQDVTARQLAVSAIATLKLDAGLPVDKLDELVNGEMEQSEK